MYNYGYNAMPDYIDPNRALNYGDAAPYMDYPSSPADGMNKLGDLMKSVPVYGTIIGTAMNMIGKGIDMGMQTRNQKSLMDYQHQLNSPSTMMAEMRRAGINPAAAAQGIAGAPGAGAVAGGSAAMSQGTPSLIDTLANSENTQLGAEAMRAEINKNKQITKGIEYENTIKSIEAGTYGEYRDFELKNMEEDVNNKKQAYLESKQRTDNLEQEYKNLKQDYNIKVAEEGEIKAKTYLEQTEAALNNSKKETERLQQDYLDSEKRYLDDKNEREKKAMDPEYIEQVSNINEAAKAKNNPITSEQKSIIENFHKEYGAIYKNYEEAFTRMNEYYNGTLKDNWFKTGYSNAQYQVKYWDDKLKAIENKYSEKLRRLGVNESESMSLLGVSRSTSK